MAGSHRWTSPITSHRTPTRHWPTWNAGSWYIQVHTCKQTICRGGQSRNKAGGCPAQTLCCGAIQIGWWADVAVSHSLGRCKRYLSSTHPLYFLTSPPSLTQWMGQTQITMISAATTLLMMLQTSKPPPWIWPHHTRLSSHWSIWELVVYSWWENRCWVSFLSNMVYMLEVELFVSSCKIVIQKASMTEIKIWP